MPIKSFRGKLADGAIDTITLHTNDGSTGYKIIKFDLFPVTPNVNQVSLVNVFKIPKTTVATTADFDNQILVAAGLYMARELNFSDDKQIIFDNEIFNQDIFITHDESEGSNEINYYIELEQIKLSLDENTVATLKDIRNIESQ